MTDTIESLCKQVIRSSVKAGFKPPYVLVGFGTLGWQAEVRLNTGWMRENANDVQNNDDPKVALRKLIARIDKGDFTSNGASVGLTPPTPKRRTF